MYRYTYMHMHIINSVLGHGYSYFISILHFCSVFYIHFSTVGHFSCILFCFGITDHSAVSILGENYMYSRICISVCYFIFSRQSKMWYFGLFQYKFFRKERLNWIYIFSLIPVCHLFTLDLFY